jgi:hypothetical protein
MSEWHFVSSLVIKSCVVRDQYLQTWQPQWTVDYLIPDLIHKSISPEIHKFLVIPRVCYLLSTFGNAFNLWKAIFINTGLRQHQIMFVFYSTLFYLLKIVTFVLNMIYVASIYYQCSTSF